MKRNVLTVFLASPGDLNSERQIVRDAVTRANKILSRRIGWHIELLGWEDTLPSYNRPQELINKDVDACDLFIGILWRRWGQKSGKFSSGFEEEFVRSKERRIRTDSPELWLFFKSIDKEAKRDPGEQLQRVLKFRDEQIDSKELFFKEFDDIEQWGKLIYDSIMIYVLDLSLETPKFQVEEQSISLDISQETINEELEDSEKLEKPYPDDLIDIFNTTTSKLKNNLEMSLDIWEATRIYLQASVWFSQVHTGEVFGNHEINLVYLKRNEWNLSDSEKWFVFRSVISDQYDNRPGWFWINNYSDKDITNSLVWLSVKDKKESVRIGAAKLIYEANPLVSNDTIIDWLKADDKDLIMYAIKLIRKNQIIDLHEKIAPFLNHKDSSIRDEAQNTKIEILYTIMPDNAFRYLIDAGAKVPNVISNTLNELTLNVNNDLLFEALEKGESYLRLFCAKYLRKSGVLTKEKCKTLFKDPDPMVRKEGLLGYMELGYDVEMDFIEKMFPGPDKEKGRLAGFALQPVRPSDFWPILLKKRRPEDLLLMIDFFSTDGAEAYRVLAIDYFAFIEDRIRQDLEDEFENLRKKSISKLMEKYGIDISKGWKKNTIKWLKSNFISAALDGLDLHGNQKDLKYARKYIGNTEFNLADNAAIKIIQKYGNSSDIKKLTEAASRVYDEAKRVALETAYCFSRNKGDYLKNLIERNDEKTIDLAITILSNSKTPQKENIAKTLLNHEQDRIRLKGLSVLVKSKSSKDIEKLLSDYLSNGTYYYNVISWIDKLLYSKGIYQDYYREALFKTV